MSDDYPNPRLAGIADRASAIYPDPILQAIREAQPSDPDGKTCPPCSK